MKEVKVSSLALEAMARERARVMGKQIKRISALEQAALGWKKKKEEEKRKTEEERRIDKRDEMPLISFRKIAPIPSAKDRGKDDTVEWRQFSPRGEEEEKKEKRPLNASSIWVFAKKLMAIEWARALGRKREDPRKFALEREAAQWKKKKKEEKERRIEEKKTRIQRQKEMLRESLQIFGEKLLEVKEDTNAKFAAELFEECLENVGEVMNVNWAGEGCDVWIEPWEERKLRRLRGDNLPVIYRLKIGEQLDIISYERVDQPA